MPRRNIMDTVNKSSSTLGKYMSLKTTVNFSGLTSSVTEPRVLWDRVLQRCFGGRTTGVGKFTS